MSLRHVRAALPLLLCLLLLIPTRAWAGPVSWREVTPTAEGRQWWDEGSLRRNRSGHLTVLSRFQAAPAEPEPTPANGTGSATASDAAGEGIQAQPAAAEGPSSSADGGGATAAPSPVPPGSLPAAVPQGRGASGRATPAISRLYVMELDCDQSLYRDISINGLPQFGASWQPTGSDDLTAEVLRQACAAEAA